MGDEMPVDGYFLYELKQEIKGELTKGKLRKIKGLGKTTFLFEFHRFGENHYLLFDTSSDRAHLRLTKDHPEKESSNFIQTLKKHLLNSELVDITQHEKDRILFFHFKVLDTFLGFLDRTLVFEVMGRSSNLILLDENNIIVDATNKHFSPEKRSVLSKLPYEVFPTNKILLTSEKLKNVQSPKALFETYMGFSKELSDLVFTKQAIPENLEFKPTLYKDKKVVYHAYDLELKGEKISYNTLSELLEYHFKQSSHKEDYLLEVLKKELKKYEVRLQKNKESLDENTNFEDYKILADRIYSSGLDLYAHYSEFEGYPLMYHLNLNENAQKLYQTYTKKKKSLEHLENIIKETEGYIRYFNDLIESYPTLEPLDIQDLEDELSLIKVIKPKQKQRKKRITVKSYTFDSYEIFVGRSSAQNETLTHKIAKSSDLWFHVKDGPGAHVVLRGLVNEESIRKAAYYAAINSPQKHGSSIPVDYTYIKYVKKIKGMPGYYVQYSHHKTIYIDT